MGSRHRFTSDESSRGGKRSRGGGRPSLALNELADEVSEVALRWALKVWGDEDASESDRQGARRITEKALSRRITAREEVEQVNREAEVRIAHLLALLVENAGL